MIEPFMILLKISEHFGSHINEVHEAAIAEDEAALDRLQVRNETFKGNVQRYMELDVTYVNNPLGIRVPNPARMFSVSILTDSEEAEPIFPDFIGTSKHRKATVAYANGVHTALYIPEDYEELEDETLY